MPARPVALQVWTVRDDMAADFSGTIVKVARIGYSGIEAGMDTGGMSVKDYKRFLDDLGIKLVSIHAMPDQIAANLQGIIDFSKEMGNRWVVCPYFHSESAQGYTDYARMLDESGARLKEAGLELAYHNHAHEFTRFDGSYALDLIYRNSSPQNLKAQLDTYWVKKGGEDPAAYVRKYADRLPLIHLKDMAVDGSFAEVGEGTLDFQGIFEAVDQSAVEWYIVEQDTCLRPPLESAKISFENLKKMGRVG